MEYPAEASPVRAEIDLWGQGKRLGQLRVPYSRDDSGWGTIGIPIVIIANGEGPTLLLTAGNHGDEYEGQVALLRLAQALEPASLSGRVILLPAMHYPAALAGTRKSPLDGRDFNRCFPGNPRGSFAEVLAHYIDTHLLPLCDAQMDLHAGGTGMDIVPSAVGHVLDDAGYMKKSLAMADAFNAPITLLLEEVNAGPTLLAAAERRGVVALSSELGGAGRLNPHGLAVTERGVRNVLRHLGMIDGPPERAADYGASRRMTVPDMSHYVFAPHDGIWEAADALGASVTRGAPAGRLHRIEEPLAPALVLDYGAGGLLWCTRGPGRCRAGDPVAVVARDL
jgi:N-alpha-acetyl-L-2,4-diaminobutyrate deacetylase